MRGEEGILVVYGAGSAKKIDFPEKKHFMKRKDFRIVEESTKKNMVNEGAANCSGVNNYLIHENLCDSKQ